MQKEPVKALNPRKGLRAARTASLLSALLAPAVFFAITNSRAHSQQRGQQDCTDLTGTPAVVCYATKFKATLTADQLATLQIPLTVANAADGWSNLPTSLVARNGLALGSLTTTQQAAALAVAQAALSQKGYNNTFQQLRLADDVLAANNTGGTTAGGGGTGGGGTPPGGGGGTPPGGGGTGGGGTGGGAGTLSYGDGLYYIAFLNAPSTSSTWLMQLGGHHYALNMTFAKTPVSPTPFFVGLEPQTFTVNGVTYAPLAERRDAMYNLVNSLNPTQLAAAQLNASFSDVYVGPQKDGQFPVQQGILYSALTTSQKTLVTTAIEAWVKDSPAAMSNKLLADYESSASLAKTYVAYSGTTTFNSQGDYVRIDGPHVWIEFCCQNGVVFQNQIHFHTIWRDKVNDYGGLFAF